MTRNLLEIDDLSADELRSVLVFAGLAAPPKVLAGQGVAALFEKASNRTRSSTEIAVIQLGGHPVTIQAQEVGLDVRESVEDVARTLGCYHRIICGRTFAQSTLQRMVDALATEAMNVPVVNLLSDSGHPCQALADVLTLQAAWGVGPDGLAGHRVAFVGDANNVAMSLGLACARLGIDFVVAHPAGYGFDDWTLDRLRSAGPGVITTTTDPVDGVDGADAVYTDVWVSMGQEEERAARLDAFARFGVTADLMAHAHPGAAFLHCLPAHRGEEVSHEVLEGPSSKVWLQAANRMHAIRGVFLWLLGQSEGVGA